MTAKRSAYYVLAGSRKGVNVYIRLGFRFENTQLARRRALGQGATEPMTYKTENLVDPGEGVWANGYIFDWPNSPLRVTI